MQSDETAVEEITQEINATQHLALKHGEVREGGGNVNMSEVSPLIALM